MLPHIIVKFYHFSQRFANISSSRAKSICLVPINREDVLANHLPDALFIIGSKWSDLDHDIRITFVEGNGLSFDTLKPRTS